MATSSSHLFTNPSDADIIRNFQPEYDTSSQLDDAEDTFQTPDTKEPSNVNEYSARLLLWLVCLITFVDVALLPAVSISTLGTLLILNVVDIVRGSSSFGPSPYRRTVRISPNRATSYQYVLVCSITSHL
jgi:hypothetical protein